MAGVSLNLFLEKQEKIWIGEKWVFRVYEKAEDIYIKLLLKAARRTASCQPLSIVRCSGAEFFILEQTKNRNRWEG